MATVTTKPDLIGKMGIFGPIEYACEYMCVCGQKVTYLDENGKPERLQKCARCTWADPR